MSAKAICYDNATMESFSDTLKSEGIYRRYLPTIANAQPAILSANFTLEKRSTSNRTITYIIDNTLDRNNTRATISDSRPMSRRFFLQLGLMNSALRGQCKNQSKNFNILSMSLLILPRGPSFQRMGINIAYG